MPINPEDPLERIQYIAGNSGASILLVQQEIQSTLKDLSQNISVLAIGADWATEKTNLEPYSGPEDVAYVIYTSGSTGKPKGVMIRHTSIVNRLHWMQKSIRLVWAISFYRKHLTPLMFLYGNYFGGL